MAPTLLPTPVVVLGSLAAEVLRKKVGDPIQIEASELTVAGIVDGKSVVENGDSSTYAQWVIASFPPSDASNPSITDWDKDPDQDGLVNGFEFIQGSSPTSPQGDYQGITTDSSDGKTTHKIHFRSMQD